MNNQALLCVEVHLPVNLSPRPGRRNAGYALKKYLVRMLREASTI